MSELTDLIAIAAKQKDDITAAGVDLDTISTNLSLIKARYCGTLPATVTAITSQRANTSLIESTTAVDIVPYTVATNSLYITQIEINNAASTASVLTLVNDHTSGAEILWTGLAPASTYRHITFDPPLKVGAGLDLEGKLADTNGDVTVSANGFVGAA